MNSTTSLAATSLAPNLATGFPSPWARPGSARPATAQPVILNQIRPEQAREFLARRIGEHLGRLGQLTPPPSTPYNNVDNGPEATARRVMAMAQQLLRNGQAGREQLARSIDSGLRSGREDLARAGMLNDVVTQDIDTLQQRLQDELSSQRSSASLEQYRSENSLSLQLKTRDGDIVTIELSRQWQQTRTAMDYADANTRFQANGQEASLSQQMRIRVKGQLDEGERKAIEQFMQQVAELADAFQNGSLQEVTEQAAMLSLDGNELQSFNVNLRSVEEYRSIQALQESRSLPTPVARLAQELKSLLEELTGKLPLQQPEQAAREALQQTLALNHPQQAKPLDFEALGNALRQA